MPTNKERTINACNILVEKYLNPQGKVFFTADHCPLCKIRKGFSCRGCPLANHKGYCGCNQFKTYKLAKTKLLLGINRNGLFPNTNTFPTNCKVPKEFVDRSNFFVCIIPILKGIGSLRFTAKNWSYFSELIRSW